MTPVATCAWCHTNKTPKTDAEGRLFCVVCHDLLYTCTHCGATNTVSCYYLIPGNRWCATCGRYATEKTEEDE